MTCIIKIVIAWYHEVTNLPGQYIIQSIIILYITWPGPKADVDIWVKT